MTPCPLGQAGQCYCAKQVSSFAAPSAKTAVLLLAHGSPENPDQVPEFLSYVTGGRPLPPTVVEEIRHRYSLIGFSPLPCWTLLQADQLSQSLQMTVFVGMRNWKPFIADAVKAIANQRYERVIAICLAPQNSRTSVGLYRSAVVGDGNLPFQLDFVDEWHDQPLLAKAFAEKLRSGWENASAENGAPVQRNRRVGCERSGPGSRRLDVRLPKPGYVRRPVDRPHGRGHDQESKSERPSRHLPASHRIRM
jgi:hypothetical protein